MLLAMAWPLDEHLEDAHFPVRQCRWLPHWPLRRRQPHPPRSLLGKEAGAFKRRPGSLGQHPGPVRFFTGYSTNSCLQRQPLQGLGARPPGFSAM